MMNPRAVLTLLILLATAPAAHAGWYKDALRSCRDYLTGRHPKAPRRLIERLVAIRGLPASFGFARVTRQDGPRLTLEYVDQRTMRPRTVEVNVGEVKLASSVQRWLYERELRRAALLAGKEDPTLAGKTVRLPQFDPPLAHVMRATQGELFVRVVDGARLRAIPLTVERPPDLVELPARQANMFGNLLKAAERLENHPDLRDGAAVLWEPGVPIDADMVAADTYASYEVFHDDITFRFDRPFSLPDVPSIRVPLLYRRQPLPLRIERVSLTQGLVYVRGRDWAGTLRLTADLLKHSKFRADDFAAFHTLPVLGFAPFADFRARFNEERLTAGEAVIEFTDAGDALNAPAESDAFDVYRVVYADEREVVLKNPRRTVVYDRAADLARLATSSRRLGRTAEALYLERHGTEPIFRDGGFVPSERDLTKYKFLREMRSIRADLVKIGLDVAFVDHFAVRIAVGTTKGFLPQDLPWRAFLSLMHPDRPHFNGLSPAVRQFADEAFKLAALERKGETVARPRAQTSAADQDETPAAAP